MVNIFSFKKSTIMEMFVVVVVVAIFYIFNFPHVHLCQMVLRVTVEKTVERCLHLVELNPQAAVDACRCLLRCSDLATKLDHGSGLTVKPL